MDSVKLRCEFGPAQIQLQVGEGSDGEEGDNGGSLQIVTASEREVWVLFTDSLDAKGVQLSRSFKNGGEVDEIGIES